MAVNLNTAGAGTREERLGAVTGYVGTIKGLSEGSENGTIKERGRCFSQATSCSNLCAVGQLTSIRDVAIIYHSPSGCMAGASRSIKESSKVAGNRGLTYETQILCTDMDEPDTIFGASDSLYDAILEAYNRYKPNAIFVAATCVSGIIGEDLDAITNSAAGKVPVPVVPVHCEGFKSKIWASGFDSTDHAIVKHIVQPARPESERNGRKFINFKNFSESERKVIEELFDKFDLDVQFLYSTTTIEELRRLSEAVATVSSCSALGTYLGTALDQEHGVPYIQTLNPAGIAGYEGWLRQIGEVIGEQEKVEAIIAEGRAQWLPKIEKVKERLKGKKVVVAMGSAFAFEMSRVVQELGMEVVYIMSWHVDPEYDNGKGAERVKYLADTNPDDIGVTVADQQNHELINVLREYKPDLYLSRHPGSVIWAVKQGTSALFVGDEYTAFGYQRLYRWAHTIADLLANQSFERNLASRVSLPYSEWWFNQTHDALYDPTAEDKARQKAEKKAAKLAQKEKHVATLAEKAMIAIEKRPEFENRNVTGTPEDEEAAV
ncbi:MAG: nitrogenase [Clostridiales Family XIII bacterium]|jgi:nitrogenase molybdenum-iron protein alpha chain|nr:nitrogenase [Clostridiales Family XIII bacterium]